MSGRLIPMITVVAIAAPFVAFGIWMSIPIENIHPKPIPCEKYHDANDFKIADHCGKKKGC
jgi:hypothetical protein